MTNTVNRHRTLSILLPQWENNISPLGVDRYVRLQQLLSAIPNEISDDTLSKLLCPIFATSEPEQIFFFDLFGRLELDFAASDLSNSDDNNDEDDRSTSKTQNEQKHKSSVRQERHLVNKGNLILDFENAIKPPVTWNILPEAPQKKVLDMGDGFQKTILQMRQREYASNIILDIPATIQATIQRIGMPDFRFKLRTRPTEYLFLVDQFSINDHLSALFNNIFQILKNNEVIAERFFYDGDLSLFRNEQFSDGLYVHELSYRFPNSRLVVLGSGYRLISSNNGQLVKWVALFRGWSTRILLTPVSQTEWGGRENQLAKLFTVLPASVESLQFVAENKEFVIASDGQLSRHIRNIIDMPSIEMQGNIMRLLSRHFDSDLLTWIAACGLYPGLYYDLTLTLGYKIEEYLGQNIVNVNNLLKISRLPWFRKSKIPPEIRYKLSRYLSHMDPALYQIVLNYLVDLMEKNPPPEESIAWADNRINMALMKFETREGLSPKGIEELREFLSVKRIDRPKRFGDFFVPGGWDRIFESELNPQIDQQEEEFKYIESARNETKGDVCVLIITPLPLEYDAVSKHLSGERDTIFKDAAAFDIGSFQGKYHHYKVIVREPSMKNIDMALVTDRAIVEFNPQIVLLIGIAGGVKDVNIGDVLVATKAYGYEGGKQYSDGFKSRPAVESFSGELLARAQVVRRQGNWKKRCSDGATEASIFIGPIAAGDKVVAGINNPTYQRIKEHYNDTLGLEMEAIGFATALQGHRKIHGLAIRGISDLCEGKFETDKQNWQPIAAERAAAVGFELLDMLNAADFIQLDEPVTKTASTTTAQPTPVNQASAIGRAEKAALVARVRKLIASGYSQEAIRELSAFTEKYLPDFHTDMLMIAAQWEGLSSKIRRGIISTSELTVEKNRIVGNLLDVLGRINQG